MLAILSTGPKKQMGPKLCINLHPESKFGEVFGCALDKFLSVVSYIIS